MLDPKAAEKATKRQHNLEVKRLYDAKERWQNRVLWGLFAVVLVSLLVLIGYEISKHGIGGASFTMPFIEKRHEQLIENNPDRK